MAYEDAKHRPHAIHTGEEPKNPITDGPYSLSVRLDRWGPIDNLFTSMYDALQSNWGDAPSRTVFRTCSGTCISAKEHMTGWCSLTADEKAYVESCFAGKTLQQVLEGITFDFCIDGVSRAFTHQNVRTRLGAGFMQHGGRDNDWRHRPWTMPETMRRMCVAHFNRQRQATTLAPALKAMADPRMVVDPQHPLQECVMDWSPIEHLLDEDASNFDYLRQNANLEEIIHAHILSCRKLYAALVDAGIPWQDARRVLPIGMQTYIHDQYNYLALSGVLTNRLEHIMDWEFNCVAQLMLREIKMQCPPLLSKYLGSASDKAKQARFAGLESWPPDRKYPSPFDDCANCGHAGSNHFPYDDPGNADPAVSRGEIEGEMVCQVCQRTGSSGPNDKSVSPLHRFVPVDRLPRQHRPEQMPFFVLHPDSMNGGDIVWIATNGEYPHRVVNNATKK